MPEALTIFGDDYIGVAAAEFVDVVDGAVQVFDDFDRDLERAVLMFHGFRLRRTEREQLVELGSGVYLHPFPFQHVAHVGEECAVHQVLVDEDCLASVASCEREPF